MDSQQKEPNFPYCNLSIITPMKTVRDMHMKCPLSWKIETLKKFIRQYHEDFLDFFKQNSWSLVFGGKTLEERETIEDIIAKNKVENTSPIIFFMQFHPNSKIKKGLNEELYEKEKAAKSHLLESLLLLDYRSKLLLSSSSSSRSLTSSNLKDPHLLASLPLMSPYFVERAKELKASFDEQKNPFRKEEGLDVDFLKSLVFDVKGSSEFRTFKYTLIARMATMFILFCVFFRNPVYIVAAIIVIQIYYTITMKNKLRKMKKKEEDRLEAFLKSKSSSVPTSSIPLSSPPPASDPPPPPISISRPKRKSISFFSRFYEMIICFTSSLYPTWDLDIYIEDHKSEEGGRNKEEGERREEKSRREGGKREGGWRKDEESEEEERKEEEGKKEGEEEKEEGKGEGEGKKEEVERKREEGQGRRVEEEFDPTDNINPQNFGLIEKMRLLHELRERMKEEEENSVASAPEEGEERREEEGKKREEEGRGKSLSYDDFDEMSPE